MVRIVLLEMSWLCFCYVKFLKRRRDIQSSEGFGVEKGGEKKKGGKTSVKGNGVGRESGSCIASSKEGGERREEKKGKRLQLPNMLDVCVAI